METSAENLKEPASHGNWLSINNPRVWSDTRLLELGLHQSYDVAPDSNRLAVVLYADGTAEWKRVTINFFDEPRRRLRTERH